MKIQHVLNLKKGLKNENTNMVAVVVRIFVAQYVGSVRYDGQLPPVALICVEHNKPRPSLIDAVKLAGHVTFELHATFDTTFEDGSRISCKATKNLSVAIKRHFAGQKRVKVL